MKLLIIILLLSSCDKTPDKVDLCKLCSKLDCSVKPTPVPTPTVTPKPDPTPVTETKEKGNYHGRHNPDRPTWYFSKKMNQYPSEITFSVMGCEENVTVPNNGTRYEYKGYSGYILKQSDVSGRGLAIIGPSNCMSTEAYLEY